MGLREGPWNAHQSRARDRTEYGDANPPVSPAMVSPHNRSSHSSSSQSFLTSQGASPLTS
jgi:hypothetical protein